MNKSVFPIMAAFLIVAIGLFILTVFGDTESESVSMENFFADVDKDGDDDLVLHADVILNGSTTFLFTEPEIDDTVDTVDATTVNATTVNATDSTISNLTVEDSINLPGGVNGPISVESYNNPGAECVIDVTDGIITGIGNNC